jgi:alpha-glucosidase
MDEWWRGAVVYQVYPRSFQDSNGDGIGDLPGITQRLDHIASLGVDAIWISPFFKSPMADYGYDVEDYRQVDPIFGSLEDLDVLIEHAHARHLRVLVDLVPCHTSERHLWFQEARVSRDNAKADWYVFADPRPDGTPPNNWLSVLGGMAWSWEPRRAQYYLHHFLPSQPALNWHNPAVAAAVVGEAEYWLERGVDGFRIDAIDFALCDPALRDNPVRPPDLPLAGGMSPDSPYARQVHVHQKSQPDLPQKVLQPLRELADRYDRALLLGELGGYDALDRIADYTHAGLLNIAYSFDLLHGEPTVAVVRAVASALEAKIDRGWACWALSNHDVTRAVSRFGSIAQAADLQPVLTAMLCSLRGTICLYQGEELGLTEADLAFEDLHDPYGIAFYPTFKGRDGCRTPIPWRAEAPFAGFSSARPWLPLPQDHPARAVDRQEADPRSVLNRTRRFLGWRRAQPALRIGDIRFVDAQEPVLALIRTHPAQKLLCVFNLSAEAARFSSPMTLKPALGHGFESSFERGAVTMPGYGAFFGMVVGQLAQRHAGGSDG